MEPVQGCAGAPLKSGLLADPCYTCLRRGPIISWPVIDPPLIRFVDREDFVGYECKSQLIELMEITP